MSVSFAFLQSPQEMFLLGHLCFLPCEIEMMELIVEKSKEEKAFQFVWELGFATAARYAPHIKTNSNLMQQEFIHRNPENALVRFYSNPIQLSYRLRAMKYVAGIIYWYKNLPDIPMPLYNRMLGLASKTAASWLLEEESRKDYHPNAMAAFFVLLSQAVATRIFGDKFTCSGQMMSVDDNRAGPKTRRLVPDYKAMVATYFAIKEYAIYISSTYSSRLYNRNDVVGYKNAAVKIKMTDAHLHFIGWLNERGVGGGIVSAFIKDKHARLSLLAHDFLRGYLLYHCECPPEDMNMPYLCLSPLQALENDDTSQPPMLGAKRLVPAALKYGYILDDDDDAKRQRMATKE